MNEPVALNTLIAVSLIPILNKYTTIIPNIAVINTSSNITIYSISLIIVIIKLETNIRATSRFSDKLKTW